MTSPTCLYCGTPTSGERMCLWCKGWGRLCRSDAVSGGKLGAKKTAPGGATNTVLQGPRRLQGVD